MLLDFLAKVGQQRVRRGFRDMTPDHEVECVTGDAAGRHVRAVENEPKGIVVLVGVDT